jgi:tRNA-splicing ligase RtcB
MISKKDFKKISNWLWEIPKGFRSDMRVPARIYASEKLLEGTEEEALIQLVNTTTMPGIVKYAIAMPDIHSGYGPPIGGVGAMRYPEGVISPGFVGYDENCGVRLLLSEYSEKEIRSYLEKLATEIQKEVPSGLGRGRAIKLSIAEINKILEGGVPYLVEKGYGEKEDIENCEHRGKMEMADANYVSQQAKNRGRDQVGTLGSGNHFLEIQKVIEIFDEETAKEFGLFKDQIVVMIHTGSRGLGHQNCTDYLRITISAYPKYGIKLPDRELACVPFNSPEGQRFFKAMSAACNFAWANRHMIMHYVRKAWKKVLGENANLKLLYDVAHNIAKIEEHEVDGKKMKLIVHRKGATRAFPPGHPELSEKYKKTGQPVLIPGSMGTPSYILVGTEKSKEVWHTVCFPGSTKILTNKGIYSLKEISERFRNEEFLVPSFDKEKYQIIWKPIENITSRKAPVIEISISQMGRETLNRLRVTPDHKFLTLSGTKIIEKEISEIIREKEMIFLIDNLPEYNLQYIEPQLAFLGGAIMSDGYVCRGGGKSKTKGRKVGFVQAPIPQKLDFINYVQSSFQNIFRSSLYLQKRESEGYIRGKLVKGSVIELTSNRIQPIQQFFTIKENLVSWVLKLSKEATLNFLAGIIDGDGSWNPDSKVINIFSTKEDITGAVVIACLKLGILPYVSRQKRDSCYIIQISEKIDEITKYTKRVKSEPHLRKYGTKLFSARQLFKGISNLKWPFSQKVKRNSLISKETLDKFLFKDKKEIERRFKINREIYDIQFREGIKKIISSPLRMQRVKKIKDLGIQEVFNLTVKDNHNYIVLTDLFSPVLVANCHGAGRTMSRHEAMRRVSGQEIVKNLESKGIIVKCYSMRGIAEEAPMAYKNVDEVVEVVHQAGLSKKVAKLTPLAVIKGE